MKGTDLAPMRPLLPVRNQAGPKDRFDDARGEKTAEKEVVPNRELRDLCEKTKKRKRKTDTSNSGGKTTPTQRKGRKDCFKKDKRECPNECTVSPIRKEEGERKATKKGERI